MKKHKDSQQLAVLVYVQAMKKHVEETVEAKYLKRIDYLVGANNELMRELEQNSNKRVVAINPETEKEYEEIEPGLW